MEPLYTYFPVLKAKPAEFDALKHLGDQHRSRIIPIFEVSPLKEYGEEEEVTNVITTSVDGVIKGLKKSLVGRPVIIDTVELGSEADASHVFAMESLIDGCRNEGILAIPTIYLSSSTALINSVKVISEKYSCAIALRLDMGSQNAIIGDNTLLESWLELNKLNRENILLLIDLQSIQKADEAKNALWVHNLLVHLNATQWKSVSLLSSAFPTTLAGFTLDGVTTVERADYALWQTVIAGLQVPGLTMHYGDYGIDAPGFNTEDLDFSVIKLIPNIRYATVSSWLVARGHVPVTGAPNHTPSVALLLTRHRMFMGAQHCHGDSLIDGCANGNGTLGNPRYWRTVGMNHHVTVVVGQLP